MYFNVFQLKIIYLSISINFINFDFIKNLILFTYLPLFLEYDHTKP